MGPLDTTSMIDVQRVEHRKSIQISTLSKRGYLRWTDENRCFLFGGSRAGRRVWAVLFRQTNYKHCLHVSDGHIYISESQQETRFYTLRIHKFKNNCLSSTGLVAEKFVKESHGNCVKLVPKQNVLFQLQRNFGQANWTLQTE